MKKPIILLLGTFIVGACSQEAEHDIAGTWDMDADKSIAATAEEFPGEYSYDPAMTYSTIDLMSGLLSGVEITDSGVTAKDDSFQGTFELNCDHSSVSMSTATSDCETTIMDNSGQFIAEWELINDDSGGMLMLRGLHDNTTFVMTRVE